MYKPNLLEQYRRKHGLTHGELSEKIEIKYHTSFRYCTGSRTPKKKFALQIKKVLGIPLSEWGYKDE